MSDNKKEELWVCQVWHKDKERWVTVSIPTSWKKANEQRGYGANKHIHPSFIRVVPFKIGSQS